MHWVHIERGGRTPSAVVLAQPRGHAPAQGLEKGLCLGVRDATAHTKGVLGIGS